ncbi:MAG: acyl-CoA carboxylase subunit epsilon [Methylocystis sp.]|nr:acyl-CoA carboxylase subunit epsilon [Methylocystis sp.]
MRHAIAVLAVFLAPTAAQAVDAPPKRKPGLWELRMETNGNAAMPGPIQNCVDEKSDNIMQHAAQDATTKCEVSALQKQGDSYVTRSVCKMGQTTTTTEGRFTGNFDSEYVGEMHSTFSPPMMGVSKSDVRISAKYLGPCKEGQKGGDIIMPNMPAMPGMPKSINMEDIKKMQERMKAMQPR